jgi:hypothetical protein
MSQLRGQARAAGGGVIMPSENYRFGVMLPFGKATFLIGSLTPIGSSGVSVPSEVDVDFSRDRSAPVKTLKIEVRQGVPVCTEIRLAARPDGRGLRPADLEAIDLTNWIEDILSECSFEVTPDGLIVSAPGTHDGRTAISHAQKAGRRKVTPELLARVATVYREHINEAPIEAVREEFDVSYRTAARYVEMCRSDDYQLLPKTDKGKRKA